MNANRDRLADAVRQGCLSGWVVMLALIATSLGGCSPPVPVSESSPPTVQTASATGPAVGAEKPLQEICRLIARRLEVMPGVAQAKWNRQLPITDEKREQALLTKLAAEGETLHLPSALVTEFFRAQIVAAKQVQEESFQEWKAQQHPPFENPPDLEKEVRPQIDEINQEMLKGLAECWEQRSAKDWSTALDNAQRAAFSSQRWSEAVVATATKPLRDFSTAAK